MNFPKWINKILHYSYYMHLGGVSFALIFKSGPNLMKNMRLNLSGADGYALPELE